MKKFLHKGKRKADDHQSPSFPDIIQCDDKFETMQVPPKKFNMEDHVDIFSLILFYSFMEHTFYDIYEVLLKTCQKKT